MHCHKCGCELSNDDKFCYNCGEKQKANKAKEATNTFLTGCAIWIFIFIAISIFTTLLTPTVTKSTQPMQNKTSSTKTTQKPIVPNYKSKMVFSDEYEGIYAFKINPSEFNTSKFVNYAKTLPRSQKGNSSFVFVFDKNIHSNTKNIFEGLLMSDKNIPLYTTDIFWKQYPYFYYSNAFELTQSYCEINGLEQKYYEKNQALLVNDTNFVHKYNLTSPRAFGLSSLNGCNPEYVMDNYNSQIEMELGAIFGINFREE